MNYEIKKIKNERFTMNYLRFGKGKQAFVILPGLSVQSVMGSAPAIENQYKLFTEDFTVYLFDRRSDIPASYDIFQMAEDTVCAIKELGLSEISLFGVSQGGMIAMTIAALYPGLVSRLSLSSTTVRATEKRIRVIREWSALAAKKDREGLFLSMGEKIYPRSYFEKYRHAFVLLSHTVTNEELARFIILADGISGFDLTDRIGQINCPVQLSYDEEDKVFPEDPVPELKEHLSALPVFESRSFNGYGHSLYDTAPGFGKWLFDFFR